MQGIEEHKQLENLSYLCGAEKKKPKEGCFKNNKANQPKKSQRRPNTSDGRERPPESRCFVQNKRKKGKKIIGMSQLKQIITSRK